MAIQGRRENPLLSLTSLGGHWLADEIQNNEGHCIDDTPANKSQIIQAPYWSPYVNNGGTVLAIAGDNYAVIAADTRVSVDFSILTRVSSKISQLTNNCMIATAGMHAEMETLHRILRVRIQRYEHEHKKQPNISAVAQLLSTILYYKRFFPYYAFNIISGLDDEGRGTVYEFDAIGCIQKVPYAAYGTGGTLILPLLDNQIRQTNQLYKRITMNKLEVINLVKVAFNSAAQRDIYTGDLAEIKIVEQSGDISTTHFDLKKD